MQEADWENTCGDLLKQNVSSHLFFETIKEALERHQNSTNLDSEIELRANVIQSFDSCYHRSVSLGHVEVNVGLSGKKEETQK